MIQSSDVRVRFAPSPTGYLHVGGLRTALYNYLFARHHNGKFILRIEDTDQTRLVEGAVENLISALHWAGIDYDEGPGKEGDCGPYIQSQRVELYRRHAHELLDHEKAYRCFCTTEELEKMREQQSAEKQTVVYDRRCRTLSAQDVQKRIDAGKPYVIRMKVPLVGELNFSDIIRGEITINFHVLDDQVLLKSEGFPTYHLANVVDDHYMRISHIIRGEEWLPSTPKHVLLYQAFGWDVPRYAHLPLLLNTDRSKLSKRQGDVAAEDYKAKGYLPDALLNFIALLGWHASDDQEIYSKEELIEKFSLDRVGKAGAIFDIEKLNWMNAQYLKKLSLDELTDLCIPYLAQRAYNTADKTRMRSVVETVSSRLTTLSSITKHAEFFFDESVQFENDEAMEILRAESSQTVMKSFVELASQNGSWSRESFKTLMKEIQKNTGVKGKDLFMPIRIALTGNMHGPDLLLIAEVFGKEKTLRRVSDALRE